MARIGFIGLGNMGGPMAANLLKAAHEVQGFDVVPDALARFAGGRARNAVDAARGAEVVITMLPAGEHVRDTYLGEGGLVDALRESGALLIDCSTIDVATARAVAAAAAGRWRPAGGVGGRAAPAGGGGRGAGAAGARGGGGGGSGGDRGGGGWGGRRRAGVRDYRVSRIPKRGPINRHSTNSPARVRRYRCQSRPNMYSAPAAGRVSHLRA